MGALPLITTLAGGEPDRPASGLVSFSALLLEREDLREAVNQADSPEAIVAIAAAEGYTFSRLELRLASRQLAASYWPWSGQGREARLAFFGEVSFPPGRASVPRRK